MNNATVQVRDKAYNFLTTQLTLEKLWFEYLIWEMIEMPLYWCIILIIREK